METQFSSDIINDEDLARHLQEELDRQYREESISIQSDFELAKQLMEEEVQSDSIHYPLHQVDPVKQQQVQCDEMMAMKLQESLYQDKNLPEKDWKLSNPFTVPSLHPSYTSPLFVRQKHEPNEPPPSNEAIKRIASDLKEIYVSNNRSIFVLPDEDNISHVNALIVGPPDTPYSHGFFHFDMLFPHDYPWRPPKVKLITTDNGRCRFNPNLYANGKVCLSILGTWTGPEWSQIQTIYSVLLSIQSLMNATPYKNEPGYEHHEINPGDIECYNACIAHETIRVAVCDILENSSCGELFRDTIEKLFLENFDDYEKRCIQGQHLDGKPIKDPFHSNRGVFEYGRSLVRIRTIRRNLLNSDKIENKKALSSDSNMILNSPKTRLPSTNSSSYSTSSLLSSPPLSNTLSIAKAEETSTTTNAMESISKTTFASSFQTKEPTMFPFSPYVGYQQQQEQQQEEDHKASSFKRAMATDFFLSGKELSSVSLLSKPSYNDEILSKNVQEDLLHVKDQSVQSTSLDSNNAFNRNTLSSRNNDNSNFSSSQFTAMKRLLEERSLSTSDDSNDSRNISFNNENYRSSVKTSTDTGKSLEEDSNNVMCVICHQTITEYLILPSCKVPHVYCMNCASKLLKLGNSRPTDPSYKENFYAPRKNNRRSMFGSPKSTSKLPSSITCVVCHSMFVLDPNNGLNTLKRRKRKFAKDRTDPRLCPEHNEECCMFCMEDVELICPTCAGSTQHIRHEVEALDVAQRILLEKLPNQKVLLEEKKAEVGNRTNTLEKRQEKIKEQIGESIKEIRSKFVLMHKALNEKEKELIDAVEKIEISANKAIERDLLHTNEQLGQIDQCIQQVNEMVDLHYDSQSLEFLVRMECAEQGIRNAFHLVLPSPNRQWFRFPRLQTYAVENSIRGLTLSKRNALYEFQSPMEEEYNSPLEEPTDIVEDYSMSSPVEKEDNFETYDSIFF